MRRRRAGACGTGSASAALSARMGLLSPRAALAAACLVSGLLTAACAALGGQAPMFATKAALAVSAEYAEAAPVFNDVTALKH